MPRLDGTGPSGQGPMTGRGRGRGKGVGSSSGKGMGGSKECTCPKCGYKDPHTRGVPCSDKKCPMCGTAMKGTFCL